MRAFLVGALLGSALIALGSCAESRPPARVRGPGVKCTTCHGDATRTPAAIAPAPPTDARGRSSTTAGGVGAHQAHLADGPLRAGLECADCHPVPANVAHFDGTVDFAWGALARSAGASPSFDAPSLTCANYCHGATLRGGSLTAPLWTQLDGTQAACGTCHGIPPPRPHPPVPSGATGCADCHGGTVRADGSVDVAGGLHLNGLVDLGGTEARCTACHGDAARTPAAIAPAPPVDAMGNTDPAAPGVGAHQSHLADGPLRAALPCTACHAVPTDMAHAGMPLDLTWGALARAAGATPSWDAGALTCVNYCHGATLAGGSLTSPRWTTVDGTQAACGTCHGLPPPAPHPDVGAALTACSTCHAGTMNADGSLDVAGGLHVDGVVQATGGHADFTAPATHGPQFFAFVSGAPGALGCTACHGAGYGGGVGPSCNACHAAQGWAGWVTNCSFCHGTRNATTRAGYDLSAHPTWAAPPDAVGQRLGGAAAPDRTGAHQPHLAGLASSGQRYAPAFACATCHAVPSDVSHVSGPSARAAVALSGAGQGSLPSSLGTYDPGTGACATFCHGSTMASSPAPPVWGAASYWPAPGSPTLACERCHGLPPPSGSSAQGAPLHLEHCGGQGLACSACHYDTADPAFNFPPTLRQDVGLHVNGAADVAFELPGTWDPGTGTCATSCHGGERSWR